MIKKLLQSLSLKLSMVDTKDNSVPIAVSSFWFVTILFILIVLLTPSTPLPIDSTVEKSSVTSPSGNNLIIPRFKDKTLAAGLTFSHLQGDDHLTGLNEVIGPGACAFDYDNDGWVDLFLVNGTGQTRFYGRQHWWHQPRGHTLYRNAGNGQFEDVTTKSGLDKQAWGMGCAFGDLDNDGNADLLVTAIGANYLYRNDGTGQFVDVTSQAGIGGNEWSTSAAIADYDNDGLLDIYVANYIRYKKGARTYEASSQFGSDLDPAFNPTLFDAEENYLFRNIGGFKFKDVTQEANVANAGGRSMDATWLDVNEDRQLDLLVVNGAGSSSNTLFINQGLGLFKEAEILAGIKTALGNTGISAGDIDNDGDLDLAIGSNNKHTPLLLIRGDTPILKNIDSNNKSKLFSDYARSLGVGDERYVGLMGWSPGLYDFNNDGWLDLFMANGLYTPDPDAHKIPQGQPKQLWLNIGQGMYENAHSENVPFRDTQSARGTAFADFDNDGDVDIYIAHNNGLGQLLVNESSGQHWLGVRLINKSGNSDAIGSRVWLHSETGTQYQVVTSGTGFLSDSDRRLHFGLGDQDNILKLIVQWSNGETQEYLNPPIDQHVILTQGTKEINTSTPTLRSPTEASTSLKLKFGAENTAYQLLYLRWLIEAVGIDAAMSELAIAVVDNDSNVRSDVTQLIGEHKTSDALKHIINALNDDNSDVYVAAINSLRFYEEEATIRWLLRAFDHTNENVRISIAECFGFFFREEEAMVHRKYLAVPHLVRMLDDTSPAVRIAAARALGDAEKYRGVLPLVHRLADPDSEVRAEAARALGLVRQRKAIPALVNILEDITQLPNVHAHAIIALKRLNYQDIDEALRTPFNHSVIHGLQTLAVITTDPNDGIVIGHETLRDLTIPHVKNNNEDIRNLAIQLLIVLAPERQKYYVSKGLKDSALSVRASTLETLIQHNIVAPKELLLKQLSTPLTSAGAISLLERYSDKRVKNQLFSIVKNPKNEIPMRVAALTSLSSMNGNLPKLPNKIFNSDNADLRDAAYNYWAKQNRLLMPKNSLPAKIEKALNDKDLEIQFSAIDILLDRREQWAIEKLKQIINNAKSKANLRRYIIENLDDSAPKQSIGWLLQLTRNSKEPERLLAMKTLTKRANQKMDYFMWQLLKNPREDVNVRFLAAEALQPRHGKAVIKILQGENPV